MMGLAEAAENAEAVTCEGSLDVTRYGGVLKARQLVGVRGAGPAFDGLYYVKSVTHKIKRGEYKQDFTLTRNGLGLHRADGDPMSDARFLSRGTSQRFYGKYRGLVIENIDPEQIGRVMVQVPGRVGRDSLQLGHALRAGGGHSGGVLHRAAHRLAGLGGIRARRSGLPHLDRRLLGVGGRRSDLCHRAARHSAGAEHRAADHGPEHDDGERCAAYSRHRRHRAQERQRRHDRGQRDRDLYQQWTGRDDHADRARRWTSTSAR